MKKILVFVLLIQIFLLSEGKGRHFSVVFTEDFEESTLGEMAARWDDVVNLEGMSLSSDVSPVSPGNQSLIITSIIGSNTGGHLYKKLVDFAGYDTLYARFYVKFADSCRPVHHFVHMGGYNPPTPWPQGGAGVKPDGDDRFTSGIEPMGSDWRWDFYTYWMHMRGNPVPNTYWGNTFHPTPTVTVQKGEWICVEIMTICNNPLSSYNGEQAFWINEEQAIHLGEGFPNGYWVWDNFYPNPDSAPFEGFQWRIVDELKVNFFWLLFYMTDGYVGQMDTVWFDDVVVATEYIGPIAGIKEEKTVLTRNVNLEIYPNPFSKKVEIKFQMTEERGQNSENGNGESDISLLIFDITGRKVREFILYPSSFILPAKLEWDGRDDFGKVLPQGIYFAKLKIYGKELSEKMIKLID